MNKLTTILEKLNYRSLNQLNKLAASLLTIEENTKLNIPSTYNHRLEYDGVENWQPKVSPILAKYKADIEKTQQNPDSDLVYRSRYANIQITNGNFLRIYNTSGVQQMIVSDYLMFNKNWNLTLNMVDRLLPYCKFKFGSRHQSYEDYQLDGWVYQGSSPNTRSITFNMESYSSLNLLLTEEQKRLAVRAMIQIMNECETNDINLENYYVISEWYRLNDMMINSYNSNIYAIETRLNFVQEPIDNLIFDTKMLLDPEEITTILYANALNGANDMYEIYQMYSNETIKDTNKSIDLTTHIDKINMATIGLNPSLPNINLETYAKANGMERTSKVLKEFKHLTKSRVNMRKWSKQDGSPIKPEELVVGLCKYLQPTGYGIIEWSENPNRVTLDIAKKALEDSNDFIDYLNGIRLKLNFTMYPILDIREIQMDTFETICFKEFKKN